MTYRLILLVALVVLLHPLTVAGQSPAPKVIVWSRENPNCSAFIVQDKAIAICKNDDNVYVSTLWAETSNKYLEHDVMIDNGSTKTFTFVRDNVSLVFVQGDQPFEVRPSDPDKIATDLLKRGRWGSFLGAMFSGMAKQTATATDPQGNVTTIQTPDYAAQARAREAQAARQARNEDAAARIRTTALRSNTIFPERKIIGALYFEMPKKFTSLDRLVVTVADTRFEFPFPKAAPKK